ncbi:MAG: DNA glycosylase [Oscillospiraceae bacterium]
MNFYKKGIDLVLDIPIEDINLIDTLDCGQCFRFARTSDNGITGIAHGKILKLTQTKNDITFHNTTKEEFSQIWRNYFDLETDYLSLKTILSKDETLQKALQYAGGIRILRQDSFEALVSFIISQNNNIPRIKASIDKLCKKFGQNINDDIYTFPSIEALSDLKKEDLVDIGLGYRDDYIVDCVAKIKNNEIDLENIKQMDIDEARMALRTIKGIGPKVAECALLFGFYRVEAFPIDTWIKKALKYYYPDGFPVEFANYAGIAQQYIFHYIRTCKDAIPEELKK